MYGMSNRTKRGKYRGAMVDVVDGQVVLEDPDALAVVRALGKINCQNTLQVNSDRVEHFKRRVDELGMTANQVVIVLLNVDDMYGGALADVLMPDHNWQEIRDRGEIPFARGLATRQGMQESLRMFDAAAAGKLESLEHRLAVVVVDHGVAEVFPA